VLLPYLLGIPPPDIEQAGSVEGADFTKYIGFDLVIGGTPCKGFSIAGKGLNFEDPESRLIFEFERAVKIIKPKYFLLENTPMKKIHVDRINAMLSVPAICIDSRLVSAQSRKRLYWTNIHLSASIEKKDIRLTDILEPLTQVYKYAHSRKGVDYMYSSSKNGRVKWKYGYHSDTRKSKSACLIKNMYKGVPHNVLIDRRRVPPLIRKFTPVECERLQTLPDGYTEMVSDTQRYRQLGNGWTVDVIAHIFTQMILNEIL